MKRAVLITSAERSQDDQLRRRQIRYLSMMSIRALCLVLVAVLVTAKVPLLWLWVVLCLAGMVLLPWLAVIVANDRPPRDRRRMRQHSAPPDPPERSLPAQSNAARVIDAEYAGPSSGPAAG